MILIESTIYGKISQKISRVKENQPIYSRHKIGNKIKQNRWTFLKDKSTLKTFQEPIYKKSFLFNEFYYVKAFQ